MVDIKHRKIGIRKKIINSKLELTIFVLIKSSEGHSGIMNNNTKLIPV